MSDTTVRFELGFRGGGHIGGQVSAGEWARVEAALAQGGGTLSFGHEEHTWWIRVDDIAYAGSVDREKRRGAGFAG